jgi:hypothetical protein
MKDLPLKIMYEISYPNSAKYPRPGDDFVLAMASGSRARPIA